MPGSNGWKSSTENFAPGVVKSVLNELGLGWSHESSDNQLTLRCPYHNEKSPSFSINQQTGAFLCFVPFCGESGGLLKLIQDIGGHNEFEALRLLSKAKNGKSISLVSQIENLIGKKEEFVEFSPDKIKILHDSMNQEAFDYMRNVRGIEKETIDYFNVGYSYLKNMITIPGYSHNNIPVGIIGRSIEGKRFQYSTGFPIAKVWFNLNKARRESNTVIVVEASMDVLKIHQAGRPNVIASLGGHVSDYKMDLLNKYFEKVVIATDVDGLKPIQRCLFCRREAKEKGIPFKECKGHDAGRELAESIRERFSREVLYAAYSSEEIYPHGAKDPGELKDDEILQCIDNALPWQQYRQTFVENV